MKRTTPIQPTEPDIIKVTQVYMAPYHKDSPVLEGSVKVQEIKPPVIQGGVVVKKKEDVHLVIKFCVGSRIFNNGWHAITFFGRDDVPKGTGQRVVKYLDKHYRSPQEVFDMLRNGDLTLVPEDIMKEVPDAAKID